MSKDSSDVAFLTKLGTSFLPASAVGVSFDIPSPSSSRIIGRLILKPLTVVSWDPNYQHQNQS